MSRWRLRFPWGSDPATFTSDYWQQQPLFLPAALPVINDAPDAAELFSLARRDEVEARLIREAPPGHWALADDADVCQMSQDQPPWTLLVQDADKHLPRVADILDWFDFLPRWRLDDVMISCASPGGSVGPHVDAYDVFLVQVSGRRRWQLGVAGDAGATVPQGPLRLIQDFSATAEFNATPGDVLYLPPGVAHHGVAVDTCSTWSIGFRAPSLIEMGAAMLESLNSDARYRDPADEIVGGSAIAPSAIASAVRLLEQKLRPDTADAARWFGALVTETKEWLAPQPPDQPADQNALRDALADGAALQRHPGALLAFTTEPLPRLLFVCGDAIEYRADQEQIVRLVCDKRRIAGRDCTNAGPDGPDLVLLAELVARGVLTLERPL